jgi:hypothetical protein
MRADLRTGCQARPPRRLWRAEIGIRQYQFCVDALNQMTSGMCLIATLVLLVSAAQADGQSRERVLHMLDRLGTTPKLVSMATVTVN